MGVAGSTILADARAARPASAIPGDGARLKLIAPPTRILDTRLDTSGEKLGSRTREVLVPGLLGTGVVGVMFNLRSLTPKAPGSYASTAATRCALGRPSCVRPRRTRRRTSTGG